MRVTILIIVIMCLYLTGCNFKLSGNNNISKSDLLLTSSVKTVSVQLTGTAAKKQQTVTPTIANIQPQESITNSLISPTLTPVNKFTPTQTQLPCYLADFVSDITIPDGAEVASGDGFTKIWRLINLGSCKWKPDFVVVFIQGTQMGSSNIYNFTGVDVDPGRTVDISIDLTAPVEPGTYQAEFLLKSSDGTIFGLGASGKGTFYLKITVPSPTPTNSPTLTLQIETIIPTAPFTETIYPTIADTITP